MTSDQLSHLISTLWVPDLAKGESGMTENIINKGYPRVSKDSLCVFVRLILKHSTPASVASLRYGTGYASILILALSTSFQYIQRGDFDILNNTRVPRRPTLLAEYLPS